MKQIYTTKGFPYTPTGQESQIVSINPQTFQNSLFPECADY